MRWLAMGLLLVLGALACLAPDVDDTGKQCDSTHVCPAGLRCVVDRCEPDGGAPDAG